MELLLVQHGKSKPKDEDPERALTVEGREEVERMAEWASQIGLAPGLICHSGKLRAYQTAETMARALSPPEGVKEIEGLAPMDDPTIAGELVEAEETAMMLVGHLPHLSRLASLLLTGDPEVEPIAFQNGGIVKLERGESGWSLDWIVIPEITA